MSKDEFVITTKYVLSAVILLFVLTAAPAMVSAANDVSVFMGVATTLAGILSVAMLASGRTDETLKKVYEKIRDAFFL